MKLVRKLARFVIPVVMIVVIGFIVNATLNQHYHLLSGGIVVKHSHPFNNPKPGYPFQDHHHTTSEFFLLEQITNIGFLIRLVFFLFIFSLIAGEKVTYLFLLPDKESELYIPHHNRAPPKTFL